MTKLERLIAAVQKGAEMRTAQREYFKHRDGKALSDSKRLEREFDRAAEAALAAPDLLGE